LAEHGPHTHRKLLGLLSDLSAESIRQSLNYLRDTKQANAERCRADGRVATVYTITPKGRRALPVTVEAHWIAGTREAVNFGAIYDGADLSRRIVRAGAYDAFTLPSLVAGQLVFRRNG
jgi:predicted ArsR family transcriptional regulator